MLLAVCGVSRATVFAFCALCGPCCVVSAVSSAVSASLLVFESMLSFLHLMCLVVVIMWQPLVCNVVCKVHCATLWRSACVQGSSVCCCPRCSVCAPWMPVCVQFFFSVFVQDDLRLPCGGSFGVNACLFCVVPNLFCVCLVETRLRSMRLWSVLCPL